MAQNRQLVEYNKKLKTNLAKAYVAIKRVTTLQNENTSLRQENYELKQESSKLKNYIQYTFGVVKALFDFPIDRLKRLVDNFIKKFEK